MFKKLLSSGNNDNAVVFRKFLDSKEVNYEEFNEESNGSYAFAFNQKLDCGPIARFVITFNEKRDTVTLYLFNYIAIQDQSKTPAIHTLINKMNNSYIFTIFYEEENEINLKYAIDIEMNFDPNTIMSQAVIMMNVSENSYPEFMKAIWS